MAYATEQYRGFGVRYAAFLVVESLAIVEKPVLFVNNVNPQPDQTDLNLEGDDQLEKYVILNGINVDIECRKFDLKAVSTVYGKNVVTGISGVEKRLYFGDSTEVQGVTLGLTWEVNVYDEVGATAEVLRYTIHKGVLNVFTPPQAQYNSAHGLKFRVLAKKTTKDILGNSLASVPSGGCYYTIDKLT